MKSVSIVIPSRNEGKYIANCLEAIVANTYPKEYLTVIICDGNSKDKTQEIIGNYKSRYAYISSLRNMKQTTPYGLNMGIKHTESDIVIVLWAHCFIAPDFIEQCVNFLETHEEVGCVGGVIENIYENDRAKIIGFAMTNKFGVGPSHFRTGGKEGFVDTVPFGAYRREVFEKVGYFDERLTRNQDDEFNFRVRKEGYKIYLSKKIKTYYPVRTNIKKFFNQLYQYGYWKVYVNMKHGRLTTFRQIIPFFFVVFLFVGLTFSLFYPIAAITYFSIILLYLLCGFLSTFKRKMKFVSRLKVVYCYMIMHIAYGFGYANGIGDFVIIRLDPDKKMGELTR